MITIFDHNTSYFANIGETNIQLVLSFPLTIRTLSGSPSNIRCCSIKAKASSAKFGSHRLSNVFVFDIISLHSGNMPLGFLLLAKFKSCDIISTISLRNCLMACTASLAACTLPALPLSNFDGDSLVSCKSLQKEKTNSITNVAKIWLKYQLDESARAALGCMSRKCTHRNNI